MRFMNRRIKVIGRSVEVREMFRYVHANALWLSSRLLIVDNAETAAGSANALAYSLP